MDENQIGDIVINAAIELHKKLGPGLLESVYEIFLTKMLTNCGLAVQRQVMIPLEFEGEYIEECFRADMIINGKVILELKSVETIHPVHKKQLLTYLKLTDMKLGYLLNFGSNLMKDGITRIVNNL
jgi:GxxExxY protein